MLYRICFNTVSNNIIIQNLQELSSTFITPETLDEAIDRALANPIDYNFAIDLQGQQYLGRDTPIPIREKKQKAVENN